MNTRINRARTILVAPLLALTTACVSDRQVISQANDAHRELDAAVLRDAQLADYLQSVGDRILAAAREYDEAGGGSKSKRDEDNAWMFSKDMQFHLVNSKTLNAFTTGGEHMYIYSELFQQCKSEDELAAVMAHEYAHVYARHVHKGMQRQYIVAGGTVAAGLAADQIGGDEHGSTYAQLAATGAGVLGQFLSMGYTRDDEAEADALGFTFYTRAGWDPDQFAGFFQQMIDKGMDTTPEYMSDHPTLKSRVDAAKKRAASLPPEASQWRRAPVADATLFASTKDQLAQASKRAPSTEDVMAAQTLLAAVPSCLLPVDQPEQKQAQAAVARELQSRGAKP